MTDINFVYSGDGEDKPTTDLGYLLWFYDMFIDKPKCEKSRIKFVYAFNPEQKVKLTDLFSRFELNLIRTMDLDKNDIISAITGFIPFGIPEEITEQIAYYTAHRIQGTNLDMLLKSVRHWKDLVMCGMSYFYELASIDLITYNFTSKSFSWLRELRRITDYITKHKIIEVPTFEIISLLYQYVSSNLFLDERTERLLTIPFKKRKLSGITINDIKGIYPIGKNTANVYKTIIEEVIETQSVIVDYFRLGLKYLISWELNKGPHVILSDGINKEVNVYVFPQDAPEPEHGSFVPKEYICSTNGELLPRTKDMISLLTDLRDALSEFNRKKNLEHSDIQLKPSEPVDFDNVDVEIISKIKIPRLFWSFKREFADFLNISVRTIEKRLNRLVSKQVLIPYPQFAVKVLPESISLLISTDEQSARQIFSIIAKHNIFSEMWLGDNICLIHTFHRTGQALPYADTVIRELAKHNISVNYYFSKFRKDRQSLAIREIWDTNDWIFDKNFYYM